jgi:hypothetical protein
MEYGGTGTLGSRTQIPIDWARSISKAREFSQAGKIAFLRVISSFNYSEAQHAANALDPNLATPLVPANSAEHRIAMIVHWLASPEFTVEEKEAMVWAWRLKDFTGVSEAEDNPNVPTGVRLLLKGIR